MTSRKKVGFIAGAGLGAAAAAALRRRWSTRPRARTRDVLPPDEAGGSLLERLAEAIRIPTHTGCDPVVFEDFHEFLERSYPLVHERLSREVVAGHSLLYTWTGDDADAVPHLLMAHFDVVPVEEGTDTDWERPPWSGEHDGEHLWGRGALDDKGPLIALLEAVERLLASGFRPSATLHLFFGHDEESGGTGAAAAARLLEERGVRLGIVLDEGGAVVEDLLPGVEGVLALVGVGEKASVDVELIAHGETGHSSAPPRHTAIGRLASAIAAIESSPMPARPGVQAPLLRVLASLVPGARGLALRLAGRVGPLLARRLEAVPAAAALIRTTSAATVVDGGTRPNMLPSEARAVVNFRILPGDTVAAVLEHVRSLVGEGVAVEVHGFGGEPAEPPELSSTESEGYAVVEAAVAEVFPGVAVAPWILLGATDSRFFRPLADDVYRFAPFTMAAADMSRIHGPGERMRLEDAAGAVAFYRAVITRLGGTS